MAFKRTRKFIEPLDLDEAYFRAARFCAFQERSEQEVRQKLQTFLLPSDQVDTVLNRLKEDKYLSEERFVQSFVGSKLRYSQWGRAKIKQGLSAKGITSSAIHVAVSEVDELKYFENLKQLINKKAETLKTLPQRERFARLMRFGLQRGYETDLIRKAITSIGQDDDLMDETEK